MLWRPVFCAVALVTTVLPPVMSISSSTSGHTSGICSFTFKNPAIESNDNLNQKLFHLSPGADGGNLPE